MGILYARCPTDVCRPHLVAKRLPSIQFHLGCMHPPEVDWVCCDVASSLPSLGISLGCWAQVSCQKSTSLWVCLCVCDFQCTTSERSRQEGVPLCKYRQCPRHSSFWCFITKATRLGRANATWLVLLVELWSFRVCTTHRETNSPACVCTPHWVHSSSQDPLSFWVHSSPVNHRSRVKMLLFSNQIPQPEKKCGAVRLS